MRLVLGKYKCAECGRDCKLAHIPPLLYGQFLMRSASGELRYLNALEDPVYSEVAEILRKLMLRNGSDVQLPELLHKCFGYACDGDAAGYRFSITRLPACPSCGSDQLSFSEMTDPIEIIDMQVASATHRNWLSLVDTEREQLLADLINSNHTN